MPSPLIESAARAIRQQAPVPDDTAIAFGDAVVGVVLDAVATRIEALGRQGDPKMYRDGWRQGRDDALAVLAELRGEQA